MATKTHMFIVKDYTDRYLYRGNSKSAATAAHLRNRESWVWRMGRLMRFDWEGDKPIMVDAKTGMTP